MNCLVVIDVQNDFVTGSLGTPEAVEMLPRLLEKMRGFEGAVLMTLDTHGEDYADTQEGRFLPVSHCVRGTEGWRFPPGGGGPAREPRRACVREAHLRKHKPCLGA